MLLHFLSVGCEMYVALSKLPYFSDKVKSVKLVQDMFILLFCNFYHTSLDILALPKLNVY